MKFNKIVWIIGDYLAKFSILITAERTRGHINFCIRVNKLNFTSSGLKEQSPTRQSVPDSAPEASLLQRGVFSPALALGKLGTNFFRNAVLRHLC